MKKLALLIAVMCFSVLLNAQTWETQIYSLSGKSRVKTIKIKPDMKMDIRCIIPGNDSLRLSTRYDGSFIGVSDDSMKIKVNSFNEFKKFPNGIIEQKTIPGKIYLMSCSSDSGLVNIPLSDIGYLSYRNKNLDKTSEILELPIYISLMTMILSPFICYDYKEGKFNTERYKYWGLGSTIGLTVFISCEITLVNKKNFQFKTDWPRKDKKVWSFNKGQQ
jgi:hypothetical protein